MKRQKVKTSRSQEQNPERERWAGAERLMI